MREIKRELAIGVFPTTDRFRSFPSPDLMTPQNWSSTRSAPTRHRRPTVQSIPTQSQPRHQYANPEVSKVFEELEVILLEAKTVVSFEWKPKKCQGKFVPIP